MWVFRFNTIQFTAIDSFFHRHAKSNNSNCLLFKQEDSVIGLSMSWWICWAENPLPPTRIQVIFYCKYEPVATTFLSLWVLERKCRWNISLWPWARTLRHHCIEQQRKVSGGKAKRGRPGPPQSLTNGESQTKVWGYQMADLTGKRYL